MKILITGTPGVGKSTLSAEISKMFCIPHVDMSNYVKQNRLYLEFNEEYKTFVFDEDTVEKALKKHLLDMPSYVIDSHSCKVLRSIGFDLIFVLTAPIEVLYRRLNSRGYSQMKVEENIKCEIFEVVREEVEETFGDEFYVVGNKNEDDKITADEALKIVKEKMESRNPGKPTIN